MFLVTIPFCTCVFAGRLAVGEPMTKRIILLSLWFILIVGCQSNRRTLSFRVLEEGISLLVETAQSDEIPDLIVIAGVEETVPPPGLDYPLEIKELLNNTDFNANFIILLLRGQVANSGTIKEVIREEDRVFIMTNAFDPGPGNYALSGFTPPYQVISVDKETDWGKEILFVLEREGENAVDQFSHFVP